MPSYVFNFLIVVFTLNYSHLFGKNIVVAKDGSGDFTSIQEGINHCLSLSDKYQIIQIKNGTYLEKIFIDSTKHHLKIRGESKEGVIITCTQARDIWRCESDDDYGAATINIKGHDIQFQNITIINDYGFTVHENKTIPCSNAAGKVTTSTVQNFQLPREEGEKEGEKIVRKDGHQFALRSMPGATRLKFINCIFRSGGGDTVSPWDVENGAYYFDKCLIEGHVDLYCPRGNAIIKNSHFICHNTTAALWHDGSGKANDKSIIINCTFEGSPGFKLGRYHREAQMFLFNCKFSKNMADAPIYQSGDRVLKWGHRIYYKNCHKVDGDFAWHNDNTTLSIKDFSFKKVFGKIW
ncbi:MAG: pectinesterase family protein [Saprospiraceae bacterium]